jgi:AcrR family transcriptional regulator
MDDETARSTRRQRQIAVRIEQILDAAARLFATKGFHRTTTREIAEAADVAEGTLYNYFENKNDLFIWHYGSIDPDQPCRNQAQEGAARRSPVIR